MKIENQHQYDRIILILIALLLRFNFQSYQDIQNSNFQSKKDWKMYIIMIIIMIIIIIIIIIYSILCVYFLKKNPHTVCCLLQKPFFFLFHFFIPVVHFLVYDSVLNFLHYRQWLHCQQRQGYYWKNF